MASVGGMHVAEISRYELHVPAQNTMARDGPDRTGLRNARRAHRIHRRLCQRHPGAADRGDAAHHLAGGLRGRSHRGGASRAECRGWIGVGHLGDGNNILRSGVTYGQKPDLARTWVEPSPLTPGQAYRVELRVRSFSTLAWGGIVESREFTP